MNRKPIVVSRFRFALLRSLLALAVIGLGSAWVASQAERVRERKAALKYQLSRPEIVVITAETAAGLPDAFPNHPQIPFWRRWMGDKVVIRIACTGGLKPEERRQLESLFPEAVID